MKEDVAAIQHKLEGASAKAEKLGSYYRRRIQAYIALVRRLVDVHCKHCDTSNNSSDITTVSCFI